MATMLSLSQQYLAKWVTISRPSPIENYHIEALSPGRPEKKNLQNLPQLH